MKLGILFILGGIALFSLSLSWNGMAGQSFMGVGGVGLLLVGMAYLRRWPGVLGKRRGGQLMASSYLLFWPYHLLNWSTFSIFRWITRENPFDEVAPGLFVGGRLLSGDEARFKERGILSVLDLTAEFSEVHFLRSSASYLCIPLLDRSDPTMGELNVGVDYIIQRLSSGPVYVHCALGHGRSATFAAAYLLREARAGSPGAAVEMMRQKRPGIRPSEGQMRALAEFCK